MNTADTYECAKMATAGARLDLGAAVLAETTATRAYDLDANAGEDLLRAKLARERAERLLSKAEEDERTALAAVQAADTGKLRLRYDAAVAQVESWGAHAAPLLVRLVALDREISAVVDACAGVIVDAQDAHLEASQLAGALGLVADLAHRVKPPVLADLALLARVLVAEQRTKEDRVVHSFMTPEPVPAWNAPGKHAHDQARSTLASLNLEGVPTP